VLANRGSARPGGYLTLEDLSACIRSRRPAGVAGPAVSNNPTEEGRT
jgi:hypothetical protein